MWALYHYELAERKGSNPTRASRQSCSTDASLVAWLRLPRRRSTRALQLLANLIRRDCRDPIAVVNAGLPLHPVSAAAQDRNDLTLDVLLALAQHDDIPGSRLRRWRRLRLDHEQSLSCRRANSLRAFGTSRRSGLARRLREERAHQRAQLSAPALRASDRPPAMFADQLGNLHVTLAPVAVI